MHENSCRICLTSDKNLLVDLFSTRNDRNPAESVMFCTGIEIKDDDQLPQKICAKCLEDIESACEIKEKCMETDQMLKQQLKDEPQQNSPSMPFVKIEELDTIEHYDPIEDTDFTDTQQIDECDELSEGSKIKKSEECPFCKKVYRAHRCFLNHIELCQQSLSGPIINKKGRNITPRAPKDHDFKCFICQKVFKFIKDKNQHIKTDHATAKFCTVCKKSKVTPTAVENCIKYHQHPHEYLCDHCGMSFLKHSKYLYHCSTHLDTGILFKCDYCGLTTKFKDNIRRHILAKHVGSTRFPCPHAALCPDLNYTTKEGLLIHLYRFHDVPAPFNCPRCQAGFTFESEVKNHRKRCTGERRTNALIVRRIEDTVQLYEANGNNHRCKVCRAILPSLQSWKNHYQAEHKGKLSGKTRFCKLCNKSFGKNNYTRHILTVHERERNFHCSWKGCGKSFSLKVTLQSHYNTHTGEKPLACKVCPFKTGDHPTYYRHLKIHKIS